MLVADSAKITFTKLQILNDAVQSTQSAALVLARLFEYSQQRNRVDLKKLTVAQQN
jgi:hypothetical protein